MDVNLTQGAIVRMFSDDFRCDNNEFKPVLQVISSLSHLLWLSDGLHFSSFYLAKNLKDLVHSRRLQKGSIVKLNHLVLNNSQNCRVVFITDLKILLDKCELIGEPVAVPESAPSLPNIAALSIT